MVKPDEVLKDDQNETNTPSGVTARKGTIYATILNIKEFNQLIGEQDSPEKLVQLNRIVQDLKSVIPALKALSLFELFSIEEWLKPVPNNEGRLLAALLYLQQFPDQTSLSLLQGHQKNLTNFGNEIQNEVKNTFKVLEAEFSN